MEDYDLIARKTHVHIHFFLYVSGDVGVLDDFSTICKILGTLYTLRSLCLAYIVGIIFGQSSTSKGNTLDSST